MYPNQSLNYLLEIVNTMTTILDGYYSSSLHLSVERGEAIYRSFSFRGINIWNQLKMHAPTDVSYICFKKLTFSYLIANDIVYRMKS